MILLLPFLYLVLCFLTKTFRVDLGILIACMIIGLLWDIFTNDDD